MDLQYHNDRPTTLIGLVGPCVSGKTTVARMLNALGYRAKVIAQEHSYVPTMWKIITKPQFLVYLDVSYQQTLIRRPMNWSEQEFREQLFRLQHAKDNANLIISTDYLYPQQVCDQIAKCLDTFLSTNNQ